MSSPTDRVQSDRQEVVGFYLYDVGNSPFSQVVQGIFASLLLVTVTTQHAYEGTYPPTCESDADQSYYDRVSLPKVPSVALASCARRGHRNQQLLEGAGPAAVLSSSLCMRFLLALAMLCFR